MDRNENDDGVEMNWASSTTCLACLTFRCSRATNLVSDLDKHTETNRRANGQGEEPSRWPSPQLYPPNSSTTTPLFQRPTTTTCHLTPFSVVVSVASVRKLALVCLLIGN